jgi:hypothetical protein
LTAAEKAALAPVSIDKLHAFAYLADILSPVWNLKPFEDRIGRTGKPPYYPDLQIQLDVLVGMGLVEASDLKYTKDDSGVKFGASYALRFESSQLSKLTLALSDDEESEQVQTFLNALAEALPHIADQNASISS